MASTITYQKRCTRCHIIAAWTPRTGDDNPRCAAGHRMAILMIEGRTGRGKCDERCWSAIRGKCNCECGGSRHASTFGVLEAC